MSDLGHSQTEKILRQTEKEVRREYARANKEIQAKVDSYMAQFKDGAEQLRKEVAAGKATQEDYERYMTRKALTGKRWTDMRDVLAADYHNANKIAMSTVMGHMPEVYALNHDFATFQLEHDAKIDTSYTLYNHDAAERLMRSPQQLLPKPKAGTPSARAAANKDLRWNARHIQSELLQGILQGEDYHGIARRLQRVTDMNLKAAIRNARTMTTNAQNAGRMAGYERMAKKGVEMQKEWVATLDHVTRDSHVDLHGERVDLDKPFSNGLDFPGGAGEPAEVYNCRCTMICQMKGFERETVKMSPKMGDLSYEEWKSAHQSSGRSGAEKTSEQSSRTGRSYKHPINQGMFTTLSNPRSDGKQQDLIRPHSIMSDLNKSEVGRLTNKYLEDNGINVKLLYNVDDGGAFGVYDPVYREILVYCDNTKTIHDTALTVIHEAAHDRFGSTNTRSEEVRCFIEELKHDGVELTEERVRGIIKMVNEEPFYRSLPWK